MSTHFFLLLSFSLLLLQSTYLAIGSATVAEAADVGKTGEKETQPDRQGTTKWEMAHHGSQGLSPDELKKRGETVQAPAHRYSHSAQTIGHYMVITHGYFYNSLRHKANWLDDTWKFDYIKEEWSQVRITGTLRHAVSVCE